MGAIELKTLMLTLLFLTTPLFASQKNQFLHDPKIQTEFEQNYYEHKYGNFVTVRAGTMTVTQLNVSSVSVNGSVSGLNITSLNLTTGTVQSFMVIGTATNDNAPLGRIGESASSFQSLTSCATSGQFWDLTSISLTAGDWDVSVFGQFQRNGANVAEYDMGIDTVSGNSTSILATGNNSQIVSIAGGDTTHTWVPASIPVYRMSLSGTTTVYLKVYCEYSVATPKAIGRITARRVR